MTTQEMQARLEELTDRIERYRAEDKDQRHAQAKKTVETVDKMGVRLIELESQFRAQEAVCDKTEKTTTRILNLLQGDPELDQPGFLKRNTESMSAINARLEEIESDKVASKSHRSLHANLPERVESLEKWRAAFETKVKTASGLARFLYSFAGGTVAVVVGGYAFYVWLRAHFTGNP